MPQTHRRPAIIGIVLVAPPLIRFFASDPSMRPYIDLLTAVILLWISYVCQHQHPVERVPEPFGGHTLRCPQCSIAYRQSDYRPEASPWRCSRCGGKLPAFLRVA
jgi:hypothetical protein